jgi:hypothetical protein
METLPIQTLTDPWYGIFLVSEPLFDKLRVLVFVVYGGISSSQKRFFERQLGEDFRNVGCLDDIKTWPKTVEGVSVSSVL